MLVLASLFTGQSDELLHWSPGPVAGAVIKCVVAGNSMGGSETMIEIQCHQLSVSYGQRPVIENINGTFSAGSMTAIAGPNGAGKSTLLKAIIGELKPLSGHVIYQDVLPHQFGYLPQQAVIDRHFPLSVRDTVLMGTWCYTGAFRAVSAELIARSELMLQRVGLAGFATRTIGALSVGQFQRVLFARLMMQDAPVIILDEPFNAIDEPTIQDLIGLIQQWHGEGRTIIAVLHDTRHIRRYFPSTVLLSHRVMGWGSTDTVLSDDNLERVRQAQYTREDVWFS
jgi:zinc/manganese transport system ATP-binding protein